jgi:hypothetical protein
MEDNSPRPWSSLPKGVLLVAIASLPPDALAWDVPQKP